MPSQISATILADSIAPNGKRITSFELQFPRFIHAEMLTHRLFSRNAASSRAIPVPISSAAIIADPAQPVMWGAQQPGMQSDNELTGLRLFLAKFFWNRIARQAARNSSLLARIGLHKQYANRCSEYAQVYKIILTATDFANFFHLRNHHDAQPEIRQLAQAMYSARETSNPQPLNPGEWHLPYVNTSRTEDGTLIYHQGSTQLSVKDAIKISASCCAQVSYRQLDTSLNKAIRIYDRLVNASPVHASPFEHQASPMQTPSITSLTKSVSAEPGITHVDTFLNCWSGNFCGWIQHRQLIPNNVVFES